MAQLIPIINPVRVFEDRTQTIFAAADVPYSRRMVTSSEDRIVRLWDLDTGEVVKQMEGHTGEVMGLAVSRNGQMIATMLSKSTAVQSARWTFHPTMRSSSLRRQHKTTKQ